MMSLIFIIISCVSVTQSHRCILTLEQSQCTDFHLQNPKGLKSNYIEKKRLLLPPCDIDPIAVRRLDAI